jgi:hypothetical protein
MTGFGNYLYYFKTRDFSIGRFAEMMWRLNFLVMFCCLSLNNRCRGAAIVFCVCVCVLGGGIEGQEKTVEDRGYHAGL